MSGTHYWPTEPGEYIVSVRERYIAFFILENGLWHGKYHPELKHTTEQLKAMGYLGVRREKPEPEQVEYYWPDTSGPHVLETKSGGEVAWVLEYHTLGGVTEQKWRCGVMCKSREALIEMGYLGAKKPAEPVRVRFTEVTELQPTPRDVGDDEPDNAAIAKQALAELRLCRKPFETERWAYHWGPKLCAMLGGGMSTEIWVASDRVNGAVYLYHAKPKDNGKIFDTPGSPIFDVQEGAFPDLKPGECVKLVPEKEQS